MSAKQVPNSRENAEAQDQPDSLSSRVPRLTFVNSPEGRLGQSFSRRDPGPHKLSDKALRAHCRSWRHSRSSRILPGVAELGVRVIRYRRGRKLGRGRW